MFLPPSFCLALLSVVLLCVQANGDAIVDPTFQAATLLVGSVQAAALQTDGKILIVGNPTFSSATGQRYNGVGRLGPDLSCDPSFNLEANPAGTLSLIVPQADGKILVAGQFDSSPSLSRRLLARLNADGTLDRTFEADPLVNPGQPSAASLSAVLAAVVQPNDKVVLAGTYVAVGTIGGTSYWVERLNADGSADTDFAPAQFSGFNCNYTLDLALAPDGKVVVGGGFSSVNCVWGWNRLARLNADGSLDTLFLANVPTNAPFNCPKSLKVAPDGTLIVLASGVEWGVLYRCRASQWKQLDLPFSSAYPNVRGTLGLRLDAVKPDGTIVVTTMSEVSWGPFSSPSWVTGGGEIDPVTDAWSSPVGVFDSSGNSYSQKPAWPLMAVNPGGDCRAISGSITAESYSIQALAAQPDGKVIDGGSFGTANPARDNNLRRINGDGSLDTNFVTNLGLGPSASALIQSIVLQPDGKVIIGGTFRNINGVARNALARLNADGSLDSTFYAGGSLTPQATTNSPAGVFALALSPNGGLFAGGSFEVPVGFPLRRSGVARLGPDGSLDPSFVVSLDAAGYVKAMALQPDGKLAIGGRFSQVNGGDRAHLARLNSDGSLDASFNPGTIDPAAYAYVNALVLRPDGRLLIGGYFTSLNGISRIRLAQLNPDGRVDSGFVPSLGSPCGAITDIALRSDGVAMVGGQYVNDGTTNRLAVGLDPTGALVANLSVAIPTPPASVPTLSSPSYAVVQDLRLVPLADGRVLAGGLVIHRGCYEFRCNGLEI